MTDSLPPVVSAVPKTNPAKPLFKVILLGDGGVGKSSLFIRLRKNHFTPILPKILSLDFHKKDVVVDSKEVEFEFWDTSGSERYDSVTRNYYRGVHAALLVFDCNSLNSLSRLYHWIENVKLYSEYALLYLVGTKSDIHEAETSVTDDQIENFCQTHKLYGKFCISSKTGDGVDEMCEEIARTLLQRKRESFKENMSENGLQYSISMTENQEEQHCACLR
ncbi:ras-related protein Rab-13-like [Amphiura filiformis]|uniref:ras-related protein Rab-13-like n=1 Tax=Amphiura filiformis TaxID=82378 RepID=UPI003B2164D4